LAIQTGMHATSLTWEPYSGLENWQTPFRKRY